MPASISGWRRMACRIFSKPIPIPKSLSIRNLAEAAKHDGLDYPELLERLLQLGIGRARALDWAA